jgi:hypothetical protein
VGFLRGIGANGPALIAAGPEFTTADKKKLLFDAEDGGMGLLPLREPEWERGTAGAGFFPYIPCGLIGIIFGSGIGGAVLGAIVGAIILCIVLAILGSILSLGTGAYIFLSIAGVIIGALIAKN